MAGMVPSGIMNQNYQRYKQGSEMPPAVPFYAPGEEAFAEHPPMGVAGYDDNGNPMVDPSQFTAAPTQHNSLSELALAQNPNLSAAQMQQINADWEKPELFEGENAQRAEMERQLGSGTEKYASQPGVLPMKTMPEGSIPGMSIGPMNGLELAVPRDQNFFAQMQYQNQEFQNELLSRQKNHDAWSGFQKQIDKMAEQNMQNQSLEQLLADYGKF